MNYHISDAHLFHKMGSGSVFGIYGRIRARWNQK